MDIDDRQMRIVHLNGQTVGDGPTVTPNKRFLAIALLLIVPAHANLITAIN